MNEHWALQNSVRLLKNQNSQMWVRYNYCFGFFFFHSNWSVSLYRQCEAAIVEIHFEQNVIRWIYDNWFKISWNDETENNLLKKKASNALYKKFAQELPFRRLLNKTCVLMFLFLLLPKHIHAQNILALIINYLR